MRCSGKSCGFATVEVTETFDGTSCNRFGAAFAVAPAPPASLARVAEPADGGTDDADAEAVDDADADGVGAGREQSKRPAERTTTPAKRSPEALMAHPLLPST
jgi:hypothetical protein